MKNFAKIFTMLTLALAMSFTLVSCGSDSSDSDDNPIAPDPVINTTWKDTHTFSDGSKITYTLKFATTTAVYEIAMTQGTQTQSETMSYTFTRAENLVVLSPTQAGKATLEGRIENGIRMAITNASSGAEIAVLYKQ